MDLTKLSIEELNKLIEDAKAELENRKEEKIIYITEFRRGNSGYKRWAKELTSVDTTKTDCYAFAGTWLKKEDEIENSVTKGSYILEYIGRKENQFCLYKAIDNNNKELILEGDTKKLVSFILGVGKIVNKE